MSLSVHIIIISSYHHSTTAASTNHASDESGFNDSPAFGNGWPPRAGLPAMNQYQYQFIETRLNPTNSPAKTTVPTYVLSSALEQHLPAKPVPIPNQNKPLHHCSCPLCHRSGEQSLSARGSVGSRQLVARL